MNDIAEKELIISANGTNYYAIKNNDQSFDRGYGILLEYTDDPTDFQTANNLFFTHEEATAYCKWFAENEVFPVSLLDVLANIYHIEV